MKKIFTKTLVITLFTLMCVPVFVLAQSGGTQNPPVNGNGGLNGASGGTQNPPIGGNTGTANPNIIQGVIKNPLNVEGGISAIIEAVMRNIVMPLASIIVVLAILYSGFKFVIAQGAPKEIQEARQGLVWVLVGSLILLGAYGISAAIKDTVQQIIPLP